MENFNFQAGILGFDKLLYIHTLSKKKQLE